SVMGMNLWPNDPVPPVTNMVEFFSIWLLFFLDYGAHDYQGDSLSPLAPAILRGTGPLSSCAERSGTSCCAQSQHLRSRSICAVAVRRIHSTTAWILRLRAE